MWRGKREPSRGWSLAVGVLFAGLALFAVGAIAADDDELPGRVGRVADFAGELFLSPQDRPADWSPVGLNYPVTSGDNLWVSGDGRAEIDYGGGQFRLAGDTNLHVSRLDDRQLALFVAQGRLIVRLRFLDRGEIATVDAPNTQIQLTRPGLYRVEVGADRGTTTVVVREGEAIVAIVGGAQQVLPGQTASLTGAEPAYAEVHSGIGIDGFDAWNADRDRRYERSRAGSYVSRQMVGWAELDEYGSWDTHPTYGAVWYPTSVAVGWAPYRYGRWTYAGSWGWTWVDDAPWGYAPSHYGRWAWIGSRWGWCPGTYVARPVWAPALVGWYGGSGWSVSVNVGGPVYGWVPLGWGDPYVPWWGRGGCGQRCWTHYNRPYAVPYVANRAERPHAPPTVYANSRVPGAITAVAGSTMAGRRPVAPNVIALPAGAAHAPVMGSAPALKPLRIPEAGPIAKVPAPASTFYPSAKPRLAITPPTGAPARADAPAARPAFDRAPVSVRPAPVTPAATPGTATPPTTIRPPAVGDRAGRAPAAVAPAGRSGTSSPLTAVPPARVEAPAAPARAPTATAPAGRSGSWPPATAVPPARVEAPAAPARAPQSGAVPRTSGASSIALPPTPMRVAPTPGASAPPAPVAAPVAPAPGPAPRAAPQRESRGPAPAHAAPGGAAGENPRGGPRSAVEGPGQGSAPGR